jgi:hypothetical protein
MNEYIWMLPGVGYVVTIFLLAMWHSYNKHKHLK